MFKYPLSGTFTFSAAIHDDEWGEADVQYGGVIFQANGWKQTARILAMGRRGKVEFKVPSIKEGEMNVESVSVSPDEVHAACNGETFVNDFVSGAFPFVSVHHLKIRTSQFRDVRFSGSPTIPDEVNLIDPAMRGWGTLTHGRSIPKMLLPIGPKQNESQILTFRKEMNQELEAGPLVGRWSVREGQLNYKSVPATSRAFDPASHIEYLRPIQDLESLTIEFYWKSGEIEFAPTVGRTLLNLSARGMTPDRITVNTDLASVGHVDASKLDPPYAPIAPDNVPNEDSWNTMVLSRDGDKVLISLNGDALVEIPVTGHERLGIYRHQKLDLMVRSIRLTGDWPDRVPDSLMAK